MLIEYSIEQIPRECFLKMNTLYLNLKSSPSSNPTDKNIIQPAKNAQIKVDEAIE
jgi:hypothetical protein